MAEALSILVRNLPEIGADDFARRFSLRSTNLMWLLGAGASASAGIPTAEDMIWEFKQRLFISQRRTSPQAVADLSSATIRARLQAHIDSLGNLPAPGASDEYPSLFEAVYPAEADRRAYLDAKISGARPSYGHIALATLMRAQLTSVLWTTNFDPLVADACAKVYDGTGYLTTVALDAPNLAKQCFDDGRWPVEVKLHGDFRSRRLKNTSDELRLQDERLRQIMIDSCRRFGLVAVGYSGRDSSVMDTLEEALKQKGAFPAGLFWLHRGEDVPLPRVHKLLAQANEGGVEAAMVRVENFDEIMRDLVRMKTDIDTRVLDGFAVERRRWSAAPPPTGSKGWPVVRLNALPITQSPTVCRRLVCTIGGYADLRSAIESAKVDVLVARTRAGVLGFGSDADMRSAFESYGITDFDLHTIEVRRLRYDSGERGLLREALTRAIARNRGLNLIRRGSTDLLAPSDPRDGIWAELRAQVATLTGGVKGLPELQWHEGIGVRLEWAGERLWLLVEPRIVFRGITKDNRGVAADFARERTVRRYNRQLNDLIGFWAKHLAGDGGDVRALGIGDGVDAVFRMSTDTAFSRRSGA
jgi:NAD-dependent SIR2 family protein deacetylase